MISNGLINPKEKVLPFFILRGSNAMLTATRPAMSCILLYRWKPLTELNNVLKGKIDRRDWGQPGIHFKTPRKRTTFLRNKKKPKIIHGGNDAYSSRTKGRRSSWCTTRACALSTLSSLHHHHHHRLRLQSSHRRHRRKKSVVLLHALDLPLAGEKTSFPLPYRIKLSVSLSLSMDGCWSQNQFGPGLGILPCQTKTNLRSLFYWGIYDDLYR